MPKIIPLKRKSLSTRNVFYGSKTATVFRLGFIVNKMASSEMYDIRRSHWKQGYFPFFCFLFITLMERLYFKLERRLNVWGRRNFCSMINICAKKYLNSETIYPISSQAGHNLELSLSLGDKTWRGRYVLSY